MEVQVWRQVYEARRGVAGVCIGRRVVWWCVEAGVWRQACGGRLRVAGVRRQVCGGRHAAAGV